MRHAHLSAGAVLATTVATLLAFPLPIRADLYTLDFTTFTGGVNVQQVTVGYDPVSHSLGLGPTRGIAALPGADGIALTADHFLAVGGAGNNVYKVDPNGSPPGTFSGQTAPAFSEHIMVAPDGTIYTSGEPGNPSSFNSTLSGPGAAHSIVGSEAGVGITDISWSGSDPLHAFYTSSAETGNGNFGRLDLTNSAAFSTTRLLTGLPAAHGMLFDPFTQDLLLFGAGHVTQIDPAHPSAVLSDLNLSGQGFNFNDGTVDGRGHLFVASNDGRMLFVDMSSTGLVGSAGNFVTSPFLGAGLDSLTLNPSPEPGSLVLLTLGGMTLAGYAWRQRQAVRRRPDMRALKPHCGGQARIV